MTSSDVIVLSGNLDGYAMGDRLVQLGVEQTKTALSKLAKWHASGVLLGEKVR